MGRLWPVLWVGLVSMHATPLAAQDFPVKPIRWVLGFAIGGAPDNIARVVALQLTVQLGQSVVMDNRPGANGIVGAELVANS
ncbi:MAG: tripartite tricarboxylate transporter substrate-binding protein, partial [Burkholderiales bacterium]